MVTEGILWCCFWPNMRQFFCSNYAVSEQTSLRLVSCPKRRKYFYGTSQPDMSILSATFLSFDSFLLLLTSLGVQREDCHWHLSGHIGRVFTTCKHYFFSEQFSPFAIVKISSTLEHLISFFRQNLMQILRSMFFNSKNFLTTQNTFKGYASHKQNKRII
uniref:Uncharacterized protein n=1 Tax=Lepeophtheirus salmonis TaxID=72036 RepID=A0A0K2TYC6_LEPSM